ncbi:MAG: galactose mutarotase [Prevotella sp.]|nr:galactose mutarotase [Prevotella sp.]
MKLKNLFYLCGMAVALSLAACANGNGNLTKSGLDPANYDTIIGGKQVGLYTITNADGMEACITNYGGRLVSLMAKDKDGQFRDVVLSYDNVAQFTDYKNNPNDFGASVGRYANRIKEGKLTVGGKQIQLPLNNFGHCLHGGPTGWQYQVYDVDEARCNDSTIVLVMHSPDGDNGFPGNVEATVTYTLTSANTLDITFDATTDAETVINMTNHSYFNLSGNPSVPGTNMVLYINADNYTPTDSTYMTTGEVRSVYGNQFDFRQAKPLYTVVADTTGYNGLQIKYAGGLDHNWCLNTYKDGKGDDTKVAASLYSPDSGIFMQVYTNEPGLQCYTGNFLDGQHAGKRGILYPQHASVCLETQKYPDSPNKKDWVQPYLKPGETYHSHVAYRFTTK